MRQFIFAAAVALWFQHCAIAEKPAPDLADARYGSHARNSFDIWKAKTDAPAPLVVYFHGGGFSSGTKSAISDDLVNRLIENGISVMAADYRLTPEVSFPDHYLDCARAIQFARAHADEWNIDPGRIGATGSSAGGCASPWIAFHDDLADLQNGDPILRQSSRIRCAAVFSAQSSLDPDVVGEWFGDSAKQYIIAKAGPFLGVSRSELDTPRIRERFVAASPITYLTADDPPVWAYYSQAQVPIARNASSSEAIHHITFGLRLKEKMDDLGVECSVVRPDSHHVMNRAARFFQRNLAAD